jgi:hypothetical protein
MIFKKELSFLKKVLIFLIVYALVLIPSAKDQSD